MITLTANAQKQVKKLVNHAGRTKIRITLDRQGCCQGYMYKMDFCDKQLPHDVIVDYDDFAIVIGNAAQMFVIGTQIDYVENEIESQFVFNNPLQQSHCRCGKAFLMS